MTGPYSRIDHTVLVIATADIAPVLSRWAASTDARLSSRGAEAALAAAGIVFKLFFTGRFKLVSTLIYVAMGWLVVVATGPLRAELPGSTLAWLVAGGLAYTAGTLFYLARFRFAHAVWHGFVLAGSVCHFAAVLVEVLRVGI